MSSKFYVTTPIYYVNDMPHLGHAYTSVLADVVARYNRISGNDTYFLTGTDEHGAKVKRAADKKNEDVVKFVDETSLRFKELLKALNISNDDFIRTSDKKRHWPGVHKIWKELVKNGDIYKGKYKGLYCVGCEAYVTERDLVEGKCIHHDKEPEAIEEDNYFFRLSKYAGKIKSLIDSGEMVILPESRRNETLSFIESGLTDISASRPSKDIGWGVPVPDDSTQTIYVWVDALVNYISALGYGRDEKLFNKFWPADVHLMAKEILRFHTIIWPAMLMSVGLPLPKTFLIHGFINSGGRKMSKSLGNVVDPLDILKRYNADALRYYLTREVTPFEDGDFTEEKFKNAYNANLANGLGNYVNRVFKMTLTYFEGTITKPDDVLLSQIPFKKKEKESFSIPYVFEHTFWPEYVKNMGEYKLNHAMDVAWKALSELDKYVQTYEPFKLIKTNREKTEAVLWSLLYGLVNVSSMIYPFMPETSEKITNALFTESGDVKSNLEKFSLKPIGTLFPRVE